MQTPQNRDRRIFKYACYFLGRKRGLETSILVVFPEGTRNGGSIIRPWTANAGVQLITRQHMYIYIYIYMCCKVRNWSKIWAFIN